MFYVARGPEIENQYFADNLLRSYAFYLLFIVFTIVLLGFEWF